MSGRAGACACLCASACALFAACAHVDASSTPSAAAPLDVRARFYDAHAPKKPVPKASLFFSAPLVAKDGAHLEPADLLAFVDDDSATAAAVHAYDADRAWFIGSFSVGAALELVSTASTVTSVALLPRDPKASVVVFVGGRAVEVVGFGAMIAGWLWFGRDSIDERDAAFTSYDADLRARLQLE